MSLPREGPLTDLDQRETGSQHEVFKRGNVVPTDECLSAMRYLRRQLHQASTSASLLSVNWLTDFALLKADLHSVRIAVQKTSCFELTRPLLSRYVSPESSLELFTANQL